jgi:DNA invertase Pin-like site-specific DNA recombinase
VYGYCRASPSEGQAVLEAQREVIERAYQCHFAGTHAWGGWFMDRGVPGEKPLRQRPQGHKLSMALESGDLVVFTKLDRGFRNLRDALGTVEAWGQREVGVVLMDLAEVGGEQVGNRVVRLLAAVAEFERCRLSRRVNDHAAARRREGRPVWGRHPYGLKTAGPRGNKRYVPDPYTRSIGAKIVEWHLAGWSFAAIYLHLSALGIKTRLGNSWSEGTIKRSFRAELRLQQQERQQAGCG